MYYGNCHHHVITLSKCGHLTNTSDFWGCPKKFQGQISLLPPKLYEVQSGICLKKSKDEDRNPKHPLKKRKNDVYIIIYNSKRWTEQDFTFGPPPDATMISTLFPHPVSLVPRKAEISSRAPKKAAQTSDGVQGIHAFCVSRHSVFFQKESTCDPLWLHFFKWMASQIKKTRMS